MGNLVPGILRDVGDVAQLVGLNAPKPVLISGGVDGSGRQLAQSKLQQTFEWASAAYQFSGKADGLQITGAANDATVSAFLND